MKVFVTGATGFIGSATVQELIGAGHQVLGLARSDKAVASLAAAGAEVQRGALDDHDSLRDGAAASDGVIHLAYIHDFSQYEAAAQTDLRAIEILGAALEGSNRPLAIASGLAGFAGGHVATEQDVATPGFPRSANEHAALALAEQGVRSSSVRLAPTVHGDGDHGFVAALVNIARAKGVSGYVGNGSNHWPAVHRLDAAQLFRLALEKAPAGSVLHGVTDKGVPTRTIAETIGRQLNLPVVSIPPEEAGNHFGWLEMFFAADILASSTLTQKQLGWHPTHVGLIDDLEQGHYFNNEQ
ncbi:MAG: SDR family oxidoreductase [Chloroflexota bacterium]